MSTFDGFTGKLAPQSILIQRYLIIRLAGRGGMSAIYQALDMSQGRRPVAIKEMSQENLDNDERSEALARFQLEANLLERLDHPNLPRIYDNFNSGGRSFLVMDYIDGKTLLQLLYDAEKPLLVDQVLHYATQLCDVLSYLHRQNPPIIFRDLKPTNVMATREGRIYLIDFGIARFFKEGQRHDTTVLGSPGYAPPEQHGSAQTNPRSDLYALGATLHCCLTNRDPYNATDPFNFSPVRQFNPQVPVALDQLIMRLLELDERKRPTSATEVKQALLRIQQQLHPQQNSARMPATPLPGTAYQTYSTSPAPPAGVPVYQPTQVAIDPAEPQGQMILRADPPPGAATPQATLYAGQRPQNYPQRLPTQPVQKPPQTQVWTPGFSVLFIFLLIVTIGGSVLAFSINQPYTYNPAAGLNHATEAGLALLAILLAIILIAMTRSAVATLIVLLNTAATLVVSFAFLLQTLRDIQPSAQLFPQLGPAQINQLITYGLLATGMISLLWLFRLPFTWSDRFWTLLFSVAIGACAFLQMQYTDNDPLNALTKHVLLLTALIILLQTILMTGQMERKRTKT